MTPTCKTCVHWEPMLPLNDEEGNEFGLCHGPKANEVVQEHLGSPFLEVTNYFTCKFHQPYEEENSVGDPV